MDFKEKIAFLKQCDTSCVADALVRLGLGNMIPELTVDNRRCGPLNRGDRFAGPVVPIRFDHAQPGQKTWNLFDLISTQAAGSVFVMSGCKERCYTGDVYAKYARLRNIEAFVAEGFVRDIKEIAACGLPTFCAGGTTAAKGGGGAKIVSFDEPMLFYNIKVRPGDVMVGDADGLVLIPAEYLDQVVFQLEDINELEAEYLQVFDEGNNVLERLRAIGARKDMLRK